MAPNPGMLMVVGLVVLAISLLLGLTIGAVILRSACSLCKEDVPEFGRAMGISFVAGLANGGASFLIRLVVTAVVSSNPTSVQVASTLVSLPFGMLIASNVIHSMVPTSTFSRAVLIWLMQIVIMVVIGLVIGVIFVAVLGGLAGRG